MRFTSPVKSEDVGQAPNCIIVDEINQSEACIFGRVDWEGIFSRGMNIEKDFFACFLGINEFGDPVA